MSKIIAAVLIFGVVFSLVATVLMWGINISLVPMFGWNEVTFWQAFGLTILISFLKPSSASTPK